MRCLPSILVVGMALPAQAQIVVDDFEDVTDWSGLTLDTTLAVEGSGCGRWSDHESTTSASKIFTPTIDASAHEKITFWMWSAAANGAQLQLIFDSDNDGDPEGWDYYSKRIDIDWSGWKYFAIPRAEIGASRAPLGWHQINYVRFAASGWGHTPDPTTDLCLDTMQLVSPVITGVDVAYGFNGSDYEYVYTVELSAGPSARTFDLSVETDADYPFAVALSQASVTLSAGATTTVTITISIDAATIGSLPALESHDAQLAVVEGGARVDATSLRAAVPLPEATAPRLFVGAEDFARIATWVVNHAWAESARDDIIDDADAWPASYMDRYEQSGAWSLPPEGGQWTLWYVCPVHGVSLSYQGIGENRCPVDDANFTGWPYDQVIYARMLAAASQAAVDNGLAFRLTGTPAYADAAREILLAFADVYLDYPLHDVDGGTRASAAHLGAQTLDESGYAIRLSWAYDLVASTLSAAELTQIEDDLLRPLVTTIARNPTGISNWQSWHNAGIGAVGFALADPRVQADAIYAPADGFVFQMDASIDGDGFWYEGAWGYHFYALDALTQLAQMSRRAGLDLFVEQPLRAMYESPLLFAMPDLTLPPFNDSRTVNLGGRSDYEIAYAAWQNDTLAIPIESRGRDALLFGSETVPNAAQIALPSTLFEHAGYAVLRPSAGLYLALDFGPHGGWHGHFDKLGFVLHANGEQMAIDPGTQSYAAPTHDTWDKVSIAHNTVTVDQTTQGEASGSLHRFVCVPALAAVRADAGDAYADDDTRTVDLVRTMIAAPEYVVDVFEVTALDAATHQLDWIVHVDAELSTDLTLTPYGPFPSSDGYQHLENTRAAQPTGDWQVRFDRGLGSWGSVYVPEAANTGTSTISDAQAHGGALAVELAYDFATASSYMVFSSPTPPEVSEEPAALTLWVYGDGSGNRLTLRVLDRTNERFTYAVGAIDWTGWQQVRAEAISTWSHYLGNDDGVVDTPMHSVAVQINYETGAPEQSSVFVDDVVLEYAVAGNVLVADFEDARAGLRVWGQADASDTVVVGDGLGPDLLDPVPFVMVRRQGEATTFAALLEPFASEPSVDTFEVTAGDAIGCRVTGSTFDDRIGFVGAGEPGINRSFGELGCDGVLCQTRVVGGVLSRLVLIEGRHLVSSTTTLFESVAPVEAVQVEIGTTVVVDTASPLTTETRIRAPDATTVEVNGTSVPFLRDDDDVVLNAVAPDGGPEPDGGSGADGGPTEGPQSAVSRGCACDGGTPAWLAALALLLARRRRG